jgi:hypothetical protein
MLLLVDDPAAQPEDVTAAQREGGSAGQSVASCSRLQPLVATGGAPWTSAGAAVVGTTGATGSPAFVAGAHDGRVAFGPPHSWTA